MNSFQLDITPYTIGALSLMIIGVAGIVYLLRLREKSTPAWVMTFGVLAFTLSMASMFLNGIVLWGSAVMLFTDAFSALSMAAMIEFAFRFPNKTEAFWTRALRTLAWGAGLAALAISAVYAFHILTGHFRAATFPASYFFLNPLTFVVAWGISIHRAVTVQSGRAPGAAGVARALLHPIGREARMLRNLSLALTIGFVQGYVSGIGLPAQIPQWVPPTLLNLSILLMMAAVVYASFDFTAQQPSLVVRLVGVALVTILAVLVMVSLADTHLLGEWIARRYVTVADDAYEALRDGRADAIPDEATYVLRLPGAPEDAELLVSRQPGLNAQTLIEDEDGQPVWGYTIIGEIAKQASAAGKTLRFRFGEHPAGSYYQYVAFTYSIDGEAVEVGFDLAEMSQLLHAQGVGMIRSVLISIIAIVFLFPLFFQSNLILPLDRLLAGMRRADAGDLEARVTVTHNDEVGYLTTAFNKMTASLQRELDGRQAAEAELRQLNLTLEARVSERTRELEALYEVSAASSQAGDPQTLLTVLLERSLSALRTPMGFILLIEDIEHTRKLNLVASQNAPANWLLHLSTVRLEDAWVAPVIDQTEPLLLANTANDERTPDFMREGEPLTLILAALQAEGNALGVLGMARAAQDNFDLDEVALLVSIVNQVAVAVHNESLRQRVQQAHVLEDRQRLARDLHDSVTQSLYGLLTLTEVGLMRVEAQDLPGSAATYRKIGQSARQAIREMRLFIHQLRPSVLKEEGLAGALDLRLAAVEGRSDVRARLIADEGLNLPFPVETELYHIAQEALNNALKHARAANVTVTLARDGEHGVLLSVVDDGLGFDPRQARGGMGLNNMRARAAELGVALEIASTPGQGTRVSLRIESVA